MHQLCLRLVTCSDFAKNERKNGRKNTEEVKEEVKIIYRRSTDSERI